MKDFLDRFKKKKWSPPQIFATILIYYILFLYICACVCVCVYVMRQIKEKLEKMWNIFEVSQDWTSQASLPNPNLLLRVLLQLQAFVLSGEHYILAVILMERSWEGYSWFSELDFPILELRNFPPFFCQIYLWQTSQCSGFDMAGNAWSQYRCPFVAHSLHLATTACSYGICMPEIILKLLGNLGIDKASFLGKAWHLDPNLTRDIISHFLNFLLFS